MEKMEYKEKVLRILYKIQKYLKAFLTNPMNYEKFYAFLDGFLLGTTVAGVDYSMRGLVNHFTQTYEIKAQSDEVLSATINYVYPDISNEEKCKVYLQTVINYLENQ